MRLRELNKRRTREAIVRVATRLFAEEGYRETTLAEVSAAAGIASSTLHAYFPVKDDLVFSLHAAALESARERFALPLADASAVEAVGFWVENDLPEVLTRYGADTLVRVRDIVDSDADLILQERYRWIGLEQVFAGVFADAMRDGLDSLRPAVMARIASHTIQEVFRFWIDHHAADSTIDLAVLTKLTADHVRSRLEEGAEAVGVLSVEILELPD